MTFESLDAQGQAFHVVILRMTLDTLPNGGLAFTTQQTPLTVKDTAYGEINKSSSQQESDLAPYKPRCDVIVLGNAFAPGRNLPPALRRASKSPTAVKEFLINELPSRAPAPGASDTCWGGVLRVPNPFALCRCATNTPMAASAVLKQATPPLGELKINIASPKNKNRSIPKEARKHP